MIGLPEPGRIVATQWIQLIEAEGFDAAKQFLSLCRERQECPSSLVDLYYFLDIGRDVLRIYARAKLHDSLNQTEFL